MKSRMTAILLCFFLGSLGVDKFYCGKTLHGVLRILTCGGAGIWTLIDFLCYIFKAKNDEEFNELFVQK